MINPLLRGLMQAHPDHMQEHHMIPNITEPSNSSDLLNGL